MSVVVVVLDEVLVGSVVLVVVVGSGGGGSGTCSPGSAGRLLSIVVGGASGPGTGASTGGVVAVVAPGSVEVGGVPWSGPSEPAGSVPPPGRGALSTSSEGSSGLYLATGVTVPSRWITPAFSLSGSL